VVVEELNALAAVIVQMEGAGPLAEEQAQIERARVQHQPGVAAEVLVGKLADLLMHRIFVAADAFGFPDGFQRRQMARASSCRRTASWPRRAAVSSASLIPISAAISRAYFAEDCALVA
jgi:hypothetical protein